MEVQSSLAIQLSSHLKVYISLLGTSGNNRTVVDTIQFPQSNVGFSDIIMSVGLECPTGGCDPWDRKAKIDVMHLNQWFEIGRYVTPYGVECGWEFDVTDYKIYSTR